MIYCIIGYSLCNVLIIAVSAYHKVIVVVSCVSHRIVKYPEVPSPSVTVYWYNEAQIRWHKRQHLICHFISVIEKHKNSVTGKLMDLTGLGHVPIVIPPEIETSVFTSCSINSHLLCTKSSREGVLCTFTKCSFQWYLYEVTTAACLL